MNTLEKRESYLIKLARAIYESAMHEEDAQYLEPHRQLAVEAASLFNKAFNEDGILHPDLGLELILFIELKANVRDVSEMHRKEVLRIIEQIEDFVANDTLKK